MAVTTLSLNEQNQITLWHEDELPFAPAWSELSADGHKITLYSYTAEGYSLSCDASPNVLAWPNDTVDMLAVKVKNGEILEGQIVPLMLRKQQQAA